MSTAARALLDDVKARREAPLASVGLSPFPDFDRTLQTLSGTDDGGFSFNFDPKFVSEIQASENLGEYDPDIAISFDGPYVDDFPALQIPDLINTPHVGPPPGLQYPANYSIHDPFDTQSDPDRQTQRSYAGTFNPFADTFDDDLNSGGARVITEIDESFPASISPGVDRILASCLHLQVLLHLAFRVQVKIRLFMVQVADFCSSLIGHRSITKNSVIRSLSPT